MAILDFFRPRPVTSSVEVVAEQKAMTGSGAYAMEYGAPGTSWWLGSGKWDTPRGMARAQALSHANPWIDKAERLICGRAASLPWHLEDGDDETVDDEASPELQAVRRLLERPSPFTKPDVTWRDLVHITYRHMGVINVGAWYLDQLDPFGIPREIFYLNPARLTPDDKSGSLTGWLLDVDAQYHRGNPTRLELDEVITFHLIPADVGYFGTGLVETAETKANLSKYADRFASQTFATGGRRGSWLSPKEGRLPDDVFEAIVKGLKNIADSPDATKRNIVVKGAIDVQPQASTPQELQSSEIMAMSRDDLLVIWGVDVADAGVPGGSGLSSGQLRQQARQSTFENAIEPRVDVLEEKVQFRLLDRWKEAGITVELEIERPQWEDDSPAYERAAKAKDLPLRNWERREIIGLDPFGDATLDNAVWLPVGIYEAYQTPGIDGTMSSEAVVTTPATPQLGPGEEVKASLLGNTRTSVERRVTPALMRDVAKVLRAQRDEAVRIVGEKAAHLIAKPSDIRAVFNETKWNAALARAIEPHLSATAETVATETKRAIGHLNPAKADPPSFTEDVVRFVLARGGERVVEMNQTSKLAITEAIRDVVSSNVGLGASEMAAKLTDAVGGLSAWDEARAELIARTETMIASHETALKSYREYGVDRVEAIDGDGDPECADRNGRTFTLEESLGITDHPNGTLDWVPVIKATLAEPTWTDPTPPIINVTPTAIDMEPVAAALAELKAAFNKPPTKRIRRVQRDAAGLIVAIVEE